MAEKDNLQIYNSVRNVPNEALKAIGAGRLKGMSDINPMWRIKVLTEQFGPCGLGWRYEITKQWLEIYGNEVKAFCNINLFVKMDGEWSEAIPGTGGSSFVSAERNGPYVSDEAYKMALTDALSVAMKALGVGASIYFENDRDYETKYSLDAPDTAPNKAPSAPPKSSATSTKSASGSGVTSEIIGQINSCKSIVELTKMWNESTQELRDNPNFVQEFSRRKNEINNTNKR